LYTIHFRLRTGELMSVKGPGNVSPAAGASPPSQPRAGPPWVGDSWL